MCIGLPPTDADHVKAYRLGACLPDAGSYARGEVFLHVGPGFGELVHPLDEGLDGEGVIDASRPLGRHIGLSRALSRALPGERRRHNLSPSAPSGPGSSKHGGLPANQSRRTKGVDRQRARLIERNEEGGKNNEQRASRPMSERMSMQANWSSYIPPIKLPINHSGRRLSKRTSESNKSNMRTVSPPSSYRSQPHSWEQAGWRVSQPVSGKVNPPAGQQAIGAGSARGSSKVDGRAAGSSREVCTLSTRRPCPLAMPVVGSALIAAIPVPQTTTDLMLGYAC